MLTDEQRQELQRLEAAATPGPWTLDPHDEYLDGPDGEHIHWDYEGLGAMWRSEADPQLIAAIRNAAPVLLAALSAAEDREKELRAVLKEVLNALAMTYSAATEGQRPHWCHFAPPNHDATCVGMSAVQDMGRTALRESSDG